MLRTLLASAIVAAAGCVALAVATDGLRAFTTESARRVAVERHPVDLPDAVLETQTGGRVALSSLRGKWLVVDFVYTRCATYCTAQGSEFARLQDRLAAAIARGSVQLLSISFDPAHDAPAQLAAYLRRSGDRGSGWLAGRPIDPTALSRLTRAFGIIVIPDGADGYVHNAALHLVDPAGRLVEIVDSGDADRAARIVAERLAG